MHVRSRIYIINVATYSSGAYTDSDIKLYSKQEGIFDSENNEFEKAGFKHYSLRL